MLLEQNWQEKKQEIQNEQKNKQYTRSQNKDRGAR